MPLTNQNCTHGVKSKLNSRNACYHSVQNVTSSLLSPKKVKIVKYKIIFLDAVFYGCGPQTLSLRKEYRLRMSENMILWRIFGPERK
jgi:hypothetical protein